MREVLNQEIGALLLELGGRVRGTCCEDAAACCLAGADTCWCVLDDEGLEGRGVAALGAEEVGVGEGLAALHRVGGDEDVGCCEAGDGECLAGVEVGGGGADGPLFLAVTGVTLGGEVVEELRDSGEDLDSGLAGAAANLLGVLEDGGFEADDFGSQNVLGGLAPLAEGVDCAHSVGGVEDVLEVKVVGLGH